jgi:hypothetical protein
VIGSSIAVYLYVVITEWVDLAPWNNVSASSSSQKLSGTLINLAPFGLLVLAFLFDLLWLKIVAIGILLAWLGVHFAWWWAPYLWGGASAEHMEQYGRHFGSTFKFLPPRGGNPIPDAQYVTMHVLTLINVVLAALALVSAGGSRK